MNNNNDTSGLSRRDFLQLASAGATALGLGGAGAAQAASAKSGAKPAAAHGPYNILFILTDQERFFRPGELVPAGQPVVSLLPPENIKARFFVPEAQIATLTVGQVVQLLCDGCGTPLAARISRIATQPEYTPPVIYSRGSREKLVFRVEAVPSPEQATMLRPGLPVDVRLAAQ